MGERGPEPTKINWDEVEKLVSYQCTQKEISDFFGISVDTLERACMRDFGIKLADFCDKRKSLGRVKLKKIQFALAEQGSHSMAIFLGKYLLGQTDKPVDQEILEAAQESGLNREQILDALKGASAKAVEAGKKSFEQFVMDAGYPDPYEKQIEMMEYGMNGDVPRMLMGSRGYGKTDYITILGIAYMIYLDPLGETNLIITKSAERNAALLNEISEALKANGVIIERENSKFIRVKGFLEKKKKGKDHSVSALTIRSKSFRGRHPKRILMDDVVTEDDVSPATRAHVKRVYSESYKLTSNIIIVGQPVHAHDLYAELKPHLKVMNVPHGSIPQLDVDLEAMRLAGVDEKSIQASYNLTIISDGSMPFEHIKYMDEYPIGESVAFIDPSEGGDYTAMTILRMAGAGAMVVGFAWKKAWHHTLDEIQVELEKYKVGRIAFETNKTGENPITVLRGLFPGIGVVGRATTTNKESRIMAAGTMAHMIHVSRQSHKAYIDQVSTYEYNAEFDDAPDSLATCLEWLGFIKGKEPKRG